MDANKRPLHVPPQMGLYAEKHCLYQIMQEMLQGLLIYKPEEPVDFLLKQLKQDNYDVPKICILGPPASGKTTIAMWLCKQLGAARISPEALLTNSWSNLADKVQEYQEAKQKISEDLWAELIEERLQIEDCILSGWVMDGLPQSRALARELLAMGIIPKHVVVLFAPDVVLIERNLGKRVDLATGEVYHTTFDWPTEDYIRQRLMMPHGVSEVVTARRLLEYHQDYPGILQSFGHCMKLINADQPCADVFAQVFTHVQVPPRTLAPFSPRILLCGPPGSGKSVQASLLARKYGIINVCCGQLLKEAVAEETKLGELIKPYFDSGWPVADNIVVKLLSERLNRLDCYIQGWVLHGFPRDEDQARLMQRANINPNRVFFLHITPESILERLCYRMLDPVTGERYHTLYQPAASREASDRLLMHPRDLEETVKFKVDTYLRIAEGLETSFEDAIFINGDQDPQTVFEYIESYIVNPRPTNPGFPLELF